MIILLVATLAAAPARASGVPLSQPNMDQAALLAWAAKTASDALTFDYTDPVASIARSENAFSQDEWENFKGIMIGSGLVAQVRDNRQSVSASAAEPAVLQEASADAGRYRWTVKIPMTLTINSNGQDSVKRKNLTLVIERTNDRPDGIYIVQWEQD